MMRWMPSLVRRLCGAGSVLVLAGVAGCGHRIEPLIVEGSRIVVTNTTNEPWRNVQVWANNFYRAQTDVLLPGGRLDAPLRRFAGPYGRNFDPMREPLKGIEVTATTESGKPVTLVWGEGRTWKGTFDR
jgi:hypothetical protein